MGAERNKEGQQNNAGGPIFHAANRELECDVTEDGKPKQIMKYWSNTGYFSRGRSSSLSSSTSWGGQRIGAGDNSRFVWRTALENQSGSIWKCVRSDRVRRQTVRFASFCFIPCLQNVPNFQEMLEFTTLWNPSIRCCLHNHTVGIFCYGHQFTTQFASLSMWKTVACWRTCIGVCLPIVHTFHHNRIADILVSCSQPDIEDAVRRYTVCEREMLMVVAGVPSEFFHSKGFAVSASVFGESLPSAYPVSMLKQSV